MNTIFAHIRKSGVGYSFILVLVSVAFFAGLAIGDYQETRASTMTIVGSDYTAPPEGVDFAPLYKAWAIINQRYVPATSATTSTSSALEARIDDQDKVWGAVEGLAKSLGDPYTVFFPPVKNQQFNDDINGSFGGVGMEIGLRNDIVTVVTPLKDSPAEKVGVKAGDLVAKVDGVTTEGLSVEEAVKKIRGKIGTKVTLTLIRKGSDKPIEVTIVRDTIKVPTIAQELRPDNVYVIHLYSFGATSANDFRDAIRKFLESKSDKLVIDLRGNPGGFLEAAVDMAGWFLPTGKVVVEEHFGGGQENRTYRSKGYNIYGNNNFKVAVLINQGSASASEILAGALQEQGVAKLIGERSFGKGSVQELINVTPETSLKVTVAQWLTPNGRSISAGGLTPDIPVTFTEDDLKLGRDTQLERAAVYLKTGN